MCFIIIFYAACVEPFVCFSTPGKSMDCISSATFRSGRSTSRWRCNDPSNGHFVSAHGVIQGSVQRLSRVDPTFCPATGESAVVSNSPPPQAASQDSIECSRRVTLDWTGIFSSLGDPSPPSCCQDAFWLSFCLTSTRAAGEEQGNCCSLKFPFS